MNIVPLNHWVRFSVKVWVKVEVRVQEGFSLEFFFFVFF